MYGNKTDVLGLIPQKASMKDLPGNVFINDPAKTMPWLGVEYRENPVVAELSKRHINPGALNFAQEQKVSLLPGHEQEIYHTGGMIPLPNSGIYSGLK